MTAMIATLLSSFFASVSGAFVVVGAFGVVGASVAATDRSAADCLAFVRACLAVATSADKFLTFSSKSIFSSFSLAHFLLAEPHVPICPSTRVTSFFAVASDVSISSTSFLAATTSAASVGATVRAPPAIVVALLLTVGSGSGSGDVVDDEEVSNTELVVAFVGVVVGLGVVFVVVVVVVDVVVVVVMVVVVVNVIVVDVVAVVVVVVVAVVVVASLTGALPLS